MITIVTAVYEEAKPFIDRLGLKKRSEETIYQHFVSDGYEVVITGVGSIRALRSCSRHFALFPPSADSVVLNVGICGSSSGNIGDLYLVNKITDAGSSRTYYPDLLFDNDFLQSSLTTVSSPAYHGEGLFDMEAASLYEAFVPYFTLEKMFFFKIVSDLLSPESVGDIRSLIDSKADEIIAFADKVSAFLRSIRRKIEMPDLSSVSEKFSLTVALENQLKRAVFYRLLNDQDPELSVFTDVMIENNSKAYKKELFESILERYILSSDLKKGSSVVPAGLNGGLTNVYAEDIDIPDAFKDRNIIRIDNYKDIFNRSHQNFDLQKRSQALILSRNKGRFVYKGARVCQSFGNSEFYYCSVMMNCIYDCEYCYLAGMYPSGNIVAFLNFEDLLAEVDEILKEHPMYLCVSYDTDLLAMENLFGYVSKFIEACKTRKDLTIEVRTKSGNPGVFERFEVSDQVIFAWTLSPESISPFESRTAKITDRIEAMKACSRRGFKVRACFDPMIYESNWEEDYKKLVDEVFAAVTPFDVSIGVFRISTEYLKLMRRRRPDLPTVAFPFASDDGVSHYGSISKVMIDTLKKYVLQYIGADRIFVWEEQNG